MISYSQIDTLINGFVRQKLAAVDVFFFVRGVTRHRVVGGTQREEFGNKSNCIKS